MRTDLQMRAVPFLLPEPFPPTRVHFRVCAAIGSDTEQYARGFNAYMERRGHRVCRMPSACPARALCQTRRCSREELDITLNLKEHAKKLRFHAPRRRSNK